MIWKWLDRVLTVLVLVALVVLGGMYARRLFASAPPLIAAASGHIDAPVLHTQGDAPLVLVEFSDFQCPYCYRFFTETWPMVNQTFVQPGKLAYAQIDFPLDGHPFAVPAMLAANCAGQQGKYWPAHDLAFLGLHDGSFSSDRVSQTLRLDEMAYRACLNRTTLGNPNAALGQRLGVHGTPAFYLGRSNPDHSVEVVARLANATPAVITQALGTYAVRK